MTSAQQVEHTALQPKQAEVRGKVSRIRPESPPQDDPWADPGKMSADGDPAGYGDPPRPLEDRPGSIGPGQRSRIMAALSGMPRNGRLAWMGQIVGRELVSTNDLSYTEAAKVLAGLEAAK